MLFQRKFEARIVWAEVVAVFPLTPAGPNKFSSCRPASFYNLQITSEKRY